MNYTFFYIKNVISDTQTLGMIYNNTFPWLWRRHNIYNKHTAVIQLFATVVKAEQVFMIKGQSNGLETSTTHSPLNPAN
jgi:hypothetical protein